MAERGPSAAHARIVRMTERSRHPSLPERPPLPDLSRTALVGQLNQRLQGWEAVRWADGAPEVTDELRAEVERVAGRWTACCAPIRGRRCAGAAESRPSAAPRRTPPSRTTSPGTATEDRCCSSRRHRTG